MLLKNFEAQNEFFFFFGFSRVTLLVSYENVIVDNSYFQKNYQNLTGLHNHESRIHQSEPF